MESKTQSDVKSYGEDAKQKCYGYTDDQRERRRQPMQENIAPGSNKSARGIDRFRRLEKLRLAVAQNISQDTAERRGDHADQNRRKDRDLHL